MLERDAEEFSLLVCYETGKPIREARGEVERLQQTLIASADAARNLRSEVIPMDRQTIPPQTVTLVFDKGKAELANTVSLQEAGLGRISALPWNQAPVEFRQRPAWGARRRRKPAGCQE